jgi:hydrogenase expression/formation protein HypC
MTAHSAPPDRQGQGPVTEERRRWPAGGSGGSSPRAGTAAECYGDVCITCSDTAVEVTVLRLLGDGLAMVDTGQGEEEVSVALVEARAGDTILVHAREAIAIVGR